MFGEHNDVHHNTPSSSSRSTTAAAASGPVPSVTVVLSCCAGCSSRTWSLTTGGAVGLDHGDRHLLRCEATLHRGIARKVEALLDAEHGRNRQRVDLETAIDLALRRHGAGVEIDLDALDRIDDRTAERVGHSNADLETTRVGALVAEQDRSNGLRPRRVEPRGLHRRGDGACGALRIPRGAVGGQQHGVLDAERRRVAELLLGFGWTEGQHRGLAAESLDELHRLLDRALLVRTHGETQVGGVTPTVRRR